MMLEKKLPQPTFTGPKRNQLLAALPEKDYLRLLPDLEFISMPLGWALYEFNVPVDYLYFPTTSIVSLLYVTQSGASGEIAGVGNEGLVGISLFMGGESTPSRAVVQSAGNGYRLKANILKREFALGGQLQQLALRYTQALIAQMSQTAVCNRHHTPEQQLCRWLLMNLDRLTESNLVIMQEQIANMLALNLEEVAEAAGKLQRAGFVSYRSGHITVLQRSGLESRACECYSVVKREFNRLLRDAKVVKSHPVSHKETLIKPKFVTPASDSPIRGQAKAGVQSNQ